MKHAAVDVSLIISILIPLLAGVVASWLTFRFTRLQKHQELFYSAKVRTYEKFVSAMLDFEHWLRAGQDADSLQALSELNHILLKARLFMPEGLYQKISKITIPAVVGVDAIWKIVDFSLNRRQPVDQEFSVDGFKRTALTARDFFKLPGPFSPFLTSIPDIILWLKIDLGVVKPDFRFSKKKRKQPRQRVAR